MPRLSVPTASIRSMAILLARLYETRMTDVFEACCIYSQGEIEIRQLGKAGPVPGT
jgi:hypothetical protein